MNTTSWNLPTDWHADAWAKERYVTNDNKAQISYSGIQDGKRVYVVNEAALQRLQTAGKVRIPDANPETGEQQAGSYGAHKINVNQVLVGFVEGTHKTSAPGPTDHFSKEVHSDIKPDSVGRYKVLFRVVEESSSAPDLSSRSFDSLTTIESHSEKRKK